MCAASNKCSQIKPRLECVPKQRARKESVDDDVIANALRFLRSSKIARSHETRCTHYGCVHSYVGCCDSGTNFLCHCSATVLSFSPLHYDK